MSIAINGSTDGLKLRVARGAFFTSLAQIVKAIAQLGSMVILARLLAPADFGLLAMVAPLYGLALIFQDLGLGHATVQSAQVTHAQSSAVFWLNVATSLCIAVPLIFAAPLVSWFYEDDRAADLTRGFAIVIVISALGAQHSALLNRSMQFRRLAMLDALSVLSGSLGGVLIAITFRSYWALFLSYAISAAVSAMGAWIGSDFRPGRPRWEAGARQMVRLGAGITGFNLFNFIARNLDNVLIGRVWGDASLGLYDRAYKFLMFPLLQINVPLARVMLPALARLRDDEPRYRSAYLRAVSQLLLLTQPGLVFAIATADLFVPIVLGETWRAAAPIFQWMGVAALLQPISATANWLFISQARSKAIAWWGGANAVICALAFSAGLPWGPIGVAAAYSLSQVLFRSPLVLWMATRTGPVHARDVLAVAALHALAGAGSFATIALLRCALALDGLLALAFLLWVSYASAALLLWLTPSGRKMLRETLSIVAAIATRSKSVQLL